MATGKAALVLVLCVAVLAVCVQGRKLRDKALQPHDFLGGGGGGGGGLGYTGATPGGFGFAGATPGGFGFAGATPGGFGYTGVVPGGVGSSGGFPGVFGLPTPGGGSLGPHKAP